MPFGAVVVEFGAVRVGNPFGPMGCAPLCGPVVVVAGKPFGLIGVVLCGPVVVTGKPFGPIGLVPLCGPVVVVTGNPFEPIGLAPAAAVPVPAGGTDCPPYIGKEAEAEPAAPGAGRSPGKTIDSTACWFWIPVAELAFAGTPAEGLGTPLELAG